MKTLLHLLLLSILAQAQDIKIIGPHYPGLIEPNGTGLYQKHIKQALKDTSFNITETILPPKRALISFLEHDADCIYSMALPLKESKLAKTTIKSKALTQVKLFLFQKKGNPPVVSVQEVPAKTRVGGVLGNESYYTQSTEVGHIIEYAWEDLQNIEKLRRNRISYIYGFFPNLNAYKEELSFNEKKPIMEIPDSLICYQSEKNAKLMATLNTKLKPIADKELEMQRLREIDQRKVQKQYYLKSLLTDILPPPLYIIETHLVSLLGLLELQKKNPNTSVIHSYIRKLGQLEKGLSDTERPEGFLPVLKTWDSRFVSVAEKAIGTKYMETAKVSAQEYYQIVNNEYIEALSSQSSRTAKAIFNEKLTPLYAKHRKEIDDIVASILKTMSMDPSQMHNTLQDFLVDIFPPPLFLVESFLTASRITWQKNGVGNLVLYHQSLEGSSKDEHDVASFNARVNYWNKLFESILADETEIKALFDNVTSTGKDYFLAFNQTVSKMDINKYSNLQKLYNLQRDAVLKLVDAIRTRVVKLTPNIPPQHDGEPKKRQ